MDFQKLLLSVGKSLSDDEVEAIAFLCTDLLSSNPNSVESISDLFSLLINEDLLSAEDQSLLVELLLTIQRHAILRGLGVSVQQFTSRGLISPYRKLLYHLSEDITDADLKQIKFLLKEIPRRKLEQNTTLGVFLEMERMDFINEDNLDYLEDIFNSVCPVLNEKIRHFKEEVPRPRSSSLPFVLNQIPKPFTRTGSWNLSDTRPPLSPVNPSNTSYGVHQVENRPEAVTCRPNVLGQMASLDTSTRPEIWDSESQENVEGLNVYPMTGEKRGICLVVSNNDFSKSWQSLKERVGTKTDERSLEKVFEWLGFDVQIHRDCDRKKLHSLFVELGKKDHSLMDCLVCCVLTHGEEGGVYGVDGNSVKIKDLMHPFDGQMCPSLLEKPKLFFIQACQGSKEQPRVQTDGAEDETSNVFSDAKITIESIPSAADFLVGMATVPDYVSFRDRRHGTWYIQSLCRNLVKFVPRRIDLVSILTEVNNDVSKKTDDSQRKKQMPQPAFSLRKRVVFPVPKEPPPEL
ncbi:hypothetical protein CRENBAI_015710 [Crenichthys baileyi]|uniref:Caspase-8 n=1 Tax=Crenichthys baileyi TaxID=28760 RepID=A0AAV9RXS0_9TELE